MNAERVALICKALGDTNRLQIVQMLSDGEKCGCKILEKFEITQPTLSHHMKILSQTGLVSCRKEGKWTYYSISCCMFKEFKAYFDSITCYKDRRGHSEPASEGKSECSCGGN